MHSLLTSIFAAKLAEIKHDPDFPADIYTRQRVEKMINEMSNFDMLRIISDRLEKLEEKPKPDVISKPVSLPTIKHRGKSFIRLREVKDMTALSTSTIYEGMRDGWFPHAFPIGPRSVAWDLEEIKTWQENQMQSRKPGSWNAKPKELSGLTLEDLGI